MGPIFSGSELLGVNGANVSSQAPLATKLDDFAVNVKVNTESFYMVLPLKDPSVYLQGAWGPLCVVYVGILAQMAVFSFAGASRWLNGSESSFAQRSSGLEN